MHLNQIHSFLAVSKTLNFTGAARQLGVPQSTISRQINDLETQLGVRLFYRTKRDVQLTDEGRTFLPYAQEIAEAARKGSYAVRQLHEGASGTLSIAVTDACRSTVAKLLTSFHETYPEIRIDLTPLSAGESLMDDTNTPYDFWFLYREMLLDPENIEYIHLQPQSLCVARKQPSAKAAESAKASTSAKKNPAKSLPDHSDLSSESFILLSEGSDPILYMQAMNYCRTHRFTPKIANTFEDPSSVLLSVGAGLGISILPVSLADGAASVAVQPLPEEYALDCIAVWKPSLLNPAAALFLPFLQQTD